MKTLKYFIILCFAVYNDLMFAKISPLNNQTYLLISGSHGLRITNFGQSFIFSGSFTHFFHIKFPENLSHNISIQKTSISCVTIAAFLNETNFICERYKKLIDLTTKATNDFSLTYQQKFQNLLKQQTMSSWITRKKRSLFNFFGEALGALIGTSTKSELNEVKDKFEILYEKMNLNKERTAIMKKELWGLSKIVQQRSDNVDKAFNEMTKQLSALEDKLVENFRTDNFMKQSIVINRLLSAKLNDVVVSSLIELYNLIAYGHTVEDLEEAMIQMRKGLLPSNLIPPEYLKDILQKVEKEVSPLYTVGILPKNIDFYYILPLTRFSLVDDGVLLKLSIPLQTISTQTEYNVLKAITNPIPCSESFCQWYGRINSTDTFITLSIRDRAWLTDKNNVELLGEVDLSTLSCLSISGHNLCYSLDRSLIQTTTSCTQSLWSWDNSFVRQNCNFELSLKDNYQPIRLSENTWILHKEVVKSYDIICENMGSRVGAKTRALTDWAEEVTVDSNCYLNTEKFKLFGPLRERDNRLDTVPTKVPDFIFDKRYETPDLKHNDIDLKSITNEHKPQQYNRLDTKRVTNYLTLDSKAITTVVDNIYSFANEIDHEINDVSVDRQNTKYFISWQTTLNSITKICLFFSTTFIIITLIRMGYGFYGIAPIILTEVDLVDGRLWRNRDTVDFWQFFSSDPFN